MIVITLAGRQIIGTETKVGTPGAKIERTANAAIPAEGTEVDFSTDVEFTTTFSDNTNNLTLTIPTDAAEAYYRITVTNALNGDIAESEPPIICRVTKAAIAPANIELVAIDGDSGAQTSNQPSVSHGDSLRITHNPLTTAQSDGITYEWYKQYGLEPNPDDVESTDIPDVLIEGATEDRYAPTQAGKYYARIINTFNGTVNKTLTSAISVND